jgi:hypothetical protein
MKSNNSIPKDENETLDYINDSASQLDDQRKQELSNLKQTQEVRNEISKLEKDRLTTKYGADHPSVQNTESRIEYNKGAFKGLDVEIEKASIKVPVADRNSWMLHGRVMNTEYKAMQNITISLFDENQDWVKTTGLACTDVRGYFSLIYPPTGKGSEIPVDQKLFITASDKDSKILYRDTEPVYVIAGVIDYREIILAESMESCPPPGKDFKKSQLTPDSWVVKGKVTRNGVGVQGLTISLYDKDLFFDDKLGTTLSDKDGKYMIIYRTESFKELFEEKPDIYLKVLDSNGTLLYSSKKRVLPKAGKEEIIDIDLNVK